MKLFHVVYEPYISEVIEAPNHIEAIILVLVRLGIVDWEPVPLGKFEVMELS